MLNFTKYFIVTLFCFPPLYSAVDNGDEACKKYVSIFVSELVTDGSSYETLYQSKYRKSLSAEERDAHVRQLAKLKKQIKKMSKYDVDIDEFSVLWVRSKRISGEDASSPSKFNCRAKVQFKYHHLNIWLNQLALHTNLWAFPPKSS